MEEATKKMEYVTIDSSQVERYTFDLRPKWCKLCEAYENQCVCAIAERLETRRKNVSEKRLEEYKQKIIDEYLESHANPMI